MLKPLPVGIYTFSKLVQEGYLYMDKTRDIYRLLTEGEVYFLSRPRRFGKSLLLSTLEAIFQGRRELFEGLWIAGSDYGWEEHAVIRIDFSRFRARTVEELESSLSKTLQRIAQRQGLELAPDSCYEQLITLVERLAARNRVVVLVDEYDKPIIDNIEDIKQAGRIREALKGFYTILKGMDEYLRFVLLTGVSKFSKVGVFSGLNNLEDITLSPAFATLLGITEEELRQFFPDYIAAFAADEGVSEAALLERIRHWYDGFCFAAGGARVYNPFSLLLTFKQRRFANYWFESGTPTFLIKLLREAGYDLQALEGMQVNELSFSSYEVENLSPLPLLVQTGYLTIQDYDPERRLYTLGYPNREVEDAFVRYLVGAFSAVHKETADTVTWQMIDALRAGDFEGFFETLQVFFSGIPYNIQIRRERYYQTIFYLIFKLLSLQVQAEVHTSRGRIDAVIELQEGIYLFEFKLEGAGDAQAALAQIKERGYAEPYRTAERPLYLIGAVFGIEERGIVDWAVEK